MTISFSVRASEKIWLRKGLLISGIESTILYVGMNIFIPPLCKGYDSASQTVSELSAIDVPTRTMWVWLGFVYTLLVIAFAWGILLSAGQNRRLRLAGILILAYGAVSLFWPLWPMHQREFLATHGSGTLTDTMHLVLACVTVGLMVASIGFGAAASTNWFRPYSIITIVVLFVFGTLTALDAPNVSANLPTPLVGIWERVNIGVFLLWTVVLSIILLRKIHSTAQLRVS